MTEPPPVLSIEELPLVLTVEEAASALRLGRSAAYESVRRGELGAIRIGRSWRIPRHAIEHLLGLDHEPLNDEDAAVRRPVELAAQAGHHEAA